VSIDLLKCLDVIVLNESTELGERGPFLVITSSGTTSGTVTTSTSTATTTATTITEATSLITTTFAFHLSI
jgi:hypothetical protein